MGKDSVIYDLLLALAGSRQQSDSPIILNQVLLSHLKTGVILALFHCWGTTPNLNDMLNRVESGCKSS